MTRGIACTTLHPARALASMRAATLFSLGVVLSGCAGRRATTSTASSIAGRAGEPAASVASERAWWKEAIVYQIYPRSFQDSNGDGVGDLRGIISRLDYLRSLGVTMVWLNPIYESPNDDNGYDISDYRRIAPEMGTLADFDTLVAGLHARGIRLMMDLVVNHTSDKHAWFRASRSSRTNPYRDYYHWWPAERGTPPKRFSYFDEEGSAWRYDSTTNAYYLHYFGRKQPDLKWENPRVREEIFAMMRFWLDRGVDGFRLDAIPFISKDTTYGEIPARYHGDFPAWYVHGPHLHEYLHEMNRAVLAPHGATTVGEVAVIPPAEALAFVDPAREELQTLFQFEVADWGRRRGDFLYADSTNRDLRVLKDIFTRWDSTLATTGWPTIFLGNHDQGRMVSRYGNDTPPYRAASAKMLLTLLLTMRGTPYVYNGDEIGMTNIRFRSERDYRDIQTLNAFARLRRRGADSAALAELLVNQGEVGRDNARTPMQWTAGESAGFTTGTPWIAVNPNHAAVSVAAAEADTGSVLHWFRRLVALRRSEAALVYGTYRLLDRDNPDVFAYTRTLGDRTLMVALSFSTRGGATMVPNGWRVRRAVAWSAPASVARDGRVTLAPYGAAVLDLARE